MLEEVVAWYKKYRDILESDVIHLRRADARDWDGLLHVKPRLQQPALLCVFNPLDEAIEREIVVPLYYAGLVDQVQVSVAGAPSNLHNLDRRSRLRLRVQIPANGFQWVVFQAN